MLSGIREGPHAAYTARKRLSPQVTGRRVAAPVPFGAGLLVTGDSKRDAAFGAGGGELAPRYQGHSHIDSAEAQARRSRDVALPRAAKGSGK